MNKRDEQILLEKKLVDLYEENKETAFTNDIKNSFGLQIKGNQAFQRKGLSGCFGRVMAINRLIKSFISGLPTIS